MLLEKIEQDELIKCLYESSNILASDYNTKKNTLLVTFKNGQQYTYLDVKKTDYFRFEVAESQGSILNSRIKNNEFIKEGIVDTNELINEINQIKSDEIKQIYEQLYNYMGLYIKKYDETKEYDTEILIKIKNLITQIEK